LQIPIDFLLQFDYYAFFIILIGDKMPKNTTKYSAGAIAFTQHVALAIAIQSEFQEQFTDSINFDENLKISSELSKILQDIDISMINIERLATMLNILYNYSGTNNNTKNFVEYISNKIWILNEFTAESHSGVLVEKLQLIGELEEFTRGYEDNIE
jgi:hypothetical protein